MQTLVAPPRILPRQPQDQLDRGGRPGLRGWVHLRVTRARCQRSSVSGVTRNDRHADRGSARLSKANSARSTGRYSIRFTWRRSNRDLMLQHENLKFLGSVAAGSPGQQGHQSARKQMQEGQHHQAMIPNARQMIDARSDRISAPHGRLWSGCCRPAAAPPA